MQIDFRPFPLMYAYLVNMCSSPPFQFDDDSKAKLDEKKWRLVNPNE